VRGKSFACALVGAAILVGAAGASDGIGRRYAWRYYGGLQSTVDGGKHWRTMASLGYLEPPWLQLDRESGFVFAPDEDLSAQPTWTVDDGRHWYRAPGVDAPYVGNDWPMDAFDIEGTPRYAYYTLGVWSYDTPPSFGLYQVRPWPPSPSALTCPHWTHWRRFAGLVCAHPAKTLTGAPILHLPGYLPDALQLVPGGVVALVFGLDATSFAQVVVRRHERTTISQVPVDAATRLALAHGTDGSLRVDWPELDVTLWAVDGPVLVWVSKDGGRIWQRRS
jgi:hypothetical protein